MTASNSETLTRTVTVDGTLTHKVQWKDYTNVDRELTYSLSSDEYILYAEKNRPHYFRISQIASFVTWELDAIKEIADKLDTMATAGSMNEQEKANLIASFVNYGNKGMNDSFYYGPSGSISADVEYYSYPTESLYNWMLFGKIGDCDCHAILTAAIGKAAGFDTAIIVIIKSGAEGHAVAGIRDETFTEPPAQTNAYWKVVNGYYSCETFRPSHNLWVGNLENGYSEGNGYSLTAWPVRG